MTSRHNGTARTNRVRNRTGLRNKLRGARSKYGQRKTRGDFYGKWDNGRCITPERIGK